VDELWKIVKDMGFQNCMSVLSVACYSPILYYILFPACC